LKNVFQNQINPRVRLSTDQYCSQSVHWGKHLLRCCLDRFGIIIMVYFFKTFAEIIRRLKAIITLKLVRLPVFRRSGACTFHAGCIPSLNHGETIFVNIQTISAGVRAASPRGRFMHNRIIPAPVMVMVLPINCINDVRRTGLLYGIIVNARNEIPALFY